MLLTRTALVEAGACSHGLRLFDIIARGSKQIDITPRELLLVAPHYFGWFVEKGFVVPDLRGADFSVAYLEGHVFTEAKKP